MTHSEATIGELPFARSVELVVRAGYWARRLAGPPRADSVPNIIISRKMGLVCVTLPLCGTLALKQFFLSNREVDFEAERRRDTVTNVLKSKPCGDGALLLGVVRNPWSRVVSCYEKKIRGAYAKRRYRGYAGALVIAGYEGLSTRMSFAEFVEWLCAEEGRDEIANRHWMSQHRFLSPSELESERVQIIRLETMQSELNSVLARRGVPYQIIPRENASGATLSGRLYETTREYYAASTANAIGDRYAADIELFGYEF